MAAVPAGRHFVLGTVGVALLLLLRVPRKADVAAFPYLMVVKTTKDDDCCGDCCNDSDDPEDREVRKIESC